MVATACYPQANENRRSGKAMSIISDKKAEMNKPITTTLNEIREHFPCKDGWEILLKHLGKTKADDEPLELLTILDSNGMDDCLGCSRATNRHDRLWRLYAVWCVRKVQHLMTDPRSLAALDVAERFANGNATAADLADSWASACDAGATEDDARAVQEAKLRQILIAGEWVDE